MPRSSGGGGKAAHGATKLVTLVVTVAPWDAFVSTVALVPTAMYPIEVTD
jgi:hypothetical protein